MYPLPTALVVTPLYAPVIALGAVRGWTPERLNSTVLVMEKVSAAALTTGAVVLFWIAVRRRLDPAGAVLLTTAFAFGTNTWATSSQGLWQHAFAELLVAAVLVLVTMPSTTARSLIAGACLATIVTNRPQNLWLAAGLATYAVIWWLRGASRIPLIIAGVAAGTPIVLLNLLLFGHPVGAYTRIPISWLFSRPLLEGIAGLLISPGRGLFVFSPWLLVLPWAIWLGWRNRRDRALTACLVGALVIQIGFFARTDWRAGYSYGPRFLVDLLPIAAWLCAPAVAAMSTAWRSGLAVAVTVSMAIQAVGAFTYDSTSNLVYYANGDDMSPLFRIDQTQWWLEAQHPVAQSDLDDHLRLLLQ
jgi:hypothetical protein